MHTLEHYDSVSEQRRLLYLDKEFERFYKEGLAEQAALRQHPIVWYVLNLPVDSTLYPAIEYLKLAIDIGRPLQEVYDQVQEGKRSFLDRKGNVHFFRHEYHEYIHWCMPGHDANRPKEKHCGFIRTKTGDLVYTQCPGHPDHYIKGKRIHCWSLHCPECMNDTALRNGKKQEKKLLAFKTLCAKKGVDVGEVGHWVISPPQEMVKVLMQTTREYQQLVQYIEGTLKDIGALSGFTIFHPWRMKDRWVFSPHFHNICYGHLDTDRFRRENPGWIIKKVHPHQKIRSISQTAAYLYTHMGLGITEVDPDTVDWDLDIIDYLIPGIKSPNAKYSEKDYDDEYYRRGRRVGDFSNIYWEEWTMDRLVRKIRIRQWGGIARNRMRLLGTHRQHKIRVCSECGQILRTYEGFNDPIGNYVRYIQDNPVVCFAHDYDVAITAYLKYKDKLREAHLTLSDFSSSVPFAVSTLEFMPQNADIVVDGPFAEPDEYFLARQKAAYGLDALVC